MKKVLLILGSLVVTAGIILAVVSTDLGRFYKGEMKVLESKTYKIEVIADRGTPYEMVISSDTFDLSGGTTAYLYIIFHGEVR